MKLLEAKSHVQRLCLGMKLAILDSRARPDNASIADRTERQEIAMELGLPEQGNQNRDAQGMTVRDAVTDFAHRNCGRVSSL